MIRLGVLLVCAALVLTGLLQVALGHPFGWWPVAVEALLVGLLVAFERGRYAPRVDPARGTWQPNGERFRDPVSGELVDVYAEQRTGQRDYRPVG
jgi:hypothetical protein